MLNDRLGRLSRVFGARRGMDVAVNQHVDIVRNEWSAGRQVLLARAFVDAGMVQLELFSDDKRIEEIVLRPIYNEETGEEIYADKSPSTFLEHLPHALKGTYLFATVPHGLRDCDLDESSYRTISFNG